MDILTGLRQLFKNIEQYFFTHPQPNNREKRI
jgi:hypothetical protein